MDYEAAIIAQLGNTMQMLFGTVEMYQENIEALLIDYKRARDAREAQEAEDCLDRQVSLPDIKPGR